MKKIKIIFAFAALVFLSAGKESAVASAPQTSVSFQVFYNELSPYGNWVDYPGYGYAWIPSSHAGFRPYFTGGHWVYTDDGWLWASDYDWGWAPFHYGSWLYDPAYGWLWVPGYEWAPAWVVWGHYHDYYGWAPVGPRFSLTVVNYPPMEHWCFVHPRYMNSPGWHQHYYVANRHRISIGNEVINKVNNITIVNNVNTYNNHSFYSGPRRQEIESAGKIQIRPAAIRDENNPGKIKTTGDAVQVYRPRINEDKANAKPAKVIDRSELKQNTGKPATQSRENIGAKKNTNGIQPAKTNEREAVKPRNDQKKITPVETEKKTGIRPAPDAPSKIEKQEQAQPAERNVQQQPKQQNTQPHMQRRQHPAMNQQRMQQHQPENKMQQPARQEKRGR